MKFLYLLLFSFAVSAINAQDKIEYIEQQLVNVETELQRFDKTWKLDNIQKQQLIKIFDDKFRQVNAVLNSGNDKLKMSENLTSIEKEFRPKIDAVLTLEQRLALKKLNSSI